MILRIFSKTKPINFIIVTSYIFLYFIAQQYLLSSTVLSLSEIVSHIVLFIVLITTLFLVNHINNRSTISNNNAYTLLFFSIGLSFFPKIFDAKNILLSHIFILLATEKLLRIRTGIRIKQSIFDAALWISISGLFHTWTLLYLILLYIAIIQYASKDYRNWILPFIALLSVAILCYTYLLWFQNSTAFSALFSFKTQWPNLTYHPTNYFLPFILLISLSTISLIAYAINTLKKRAKKQVSFPIIITSLILGLQMFLFFGDTDNTTLIFMLFPIAVLLTHYLEHIKRTRIKESLFWSLLLIAIVLLVLRFVTGT